MKYCKYRITVQGLNSPVCCPDDDTKCFNTLNIKEDRL